MPKKKPAKPDPVTEDTDSSRYLNVKDIILAYTMKGAAGLDTLDLTSKSHLIRKAVAYCRTEERHDVADALVEYANIHGLIVWSGRGRGTPVEGSTRSYRAQQLKGQEPFIRLPVSSLHVEKGQAVTVAFRSGIIEVRSGA